MRALDAGGQPSANVGRGPVRGGRPREHQCVRDTFLAMPGAPATLHVGIDATSWRNDRGFGRFTRELVTALAARDTGFRYTLFFDQLPAEPMPAGVAVRSAATRRALNDSAVSDDTPVPSPTFGGWGGLCARSDVMCFLPRLCTWYFPILTRIPCVVCYHDATAERFPELLFPTRRNHRLWQIKTAMARFQTTRAMTVSQSSASDLQRFLRFPRERIDVVTEAADPVFRVIDDPTVSDRARARYDIAARRARSSSTSEA